MNLKDLTEQLADGLGDSEGELEDIAVIADVDGLKLPLERIEVRNGRMIIFVDMYHGLQNREEGEE